MYPFDYIPEGKKAIRRGTAWEIVDLDPADKVDATILLEQLKLKVAQLEDEKRAILEGHGADQEQKTLIKGLRMENETLRDDLAAVTEQLNTLRAQTAEAGGNEEAKPRKLRR